MTEFFLSISTYTLLFELFGELKSFILKSFIDV